LSSAGWHGHAPGRVNLIGEHVDYLGGVVLPAAVDRFTDTRGITSDKWSVHSQINGGLDYVRAIGEELGVPPQTVNVASDIPPGSGLSSSAALLVSVASGIAPDIGGKEAALACQRAEQKATGVQVGVMDQFASALGQRGHALLLNCATLDYRAVPFPDDLVIAVVDSGQHRNLAHTPYNKRRKEAESGKNKKRKRHVESEIQRVHEFVRALEEQRYERLGELLKESHVSLRDDFEVSTKQVDELVEKAWSIYGCLGARIMGAGFGGSIIALVRRGSERIFVAQMGRPVIVCATADGAYSTQA
jgi:galactokinase